MVESREVYGHSDASVLTMIQSKGVGDDGQSGKEESVDGESVEGYNGELMTENAAVKDVSTSVGEVSVVNPLESGSEQGGTPSDNEKRKEARDGVVSECVEGAYQNGVVEEGAISGVCAKTENEEVPCRSEELRESANDGNGTQSRDELLVPSLNLKKEGPDTKDAPALSHQKEVPEPVPSARKTEQGREAVHDEKDAKEDERASIENFVNETASIVNRTPDIANEWIKLLKEQEIDTVEDLKLLVEEDWDALGLPVFAARAMMNSLYGKDRQPVKEKHQTTNTSIPEYTDDLQIKDFIVDVCTLARKIENASLWEAKLTNQEIRTVGEFKSLHSKDWNKLGLSVFCYRILKNILNRKGRLPFVR
ncbi:non-specific serine/threonine protein kinase [Trachipleistophora hominis]|uniref:Non-specific serine/threonine protein kinase n=1 Tax=Trachipleistophora hominis TaxID=72359 RepID=L7JYR7_TRAHO|nr:non-specific serine/threonine protein kinase [Trachipleistophora hominis]